MTLLYLSCYYATLYGMSVIVRVNDVVIHRSPERVVWSLLHSAAAANELARVVSLLATALGVGRSLLEHSIATDLLQRIVHLLATALGVARSLVDDSLTTDLLDDVVRLVDPVDGVDHTTVDVILPPEELSLAADLFHMIVRLTVATFRVGN